MGLIVPFIFTSALDQNKRSSKYRLFPASGLGSVSTSSMDIFLRAAERHSLGWSGLCSTHLLCTMSQSKQQDSPCSLMPSSLHTTPLLCKVYLKISFLNFDPIGWFMLSFLENLLGLVHQDCISLNFLEIHAKKFHCILSIIAKIKDYRHAYVNHSLPYLSNVAN